MKKVWEGAGSLLVFWGLAGLVHELVGWFRFWGLLGRLPLVDGHEWIASAVILVLGVILVVVAEEMAGRPAGPKISAAGEGGASVSADADRARPE
ncbi:hypothetical protein HUT19_09890 [Streptomyces sp. NA02950]|uniref:hypothetical protein n=1 Tax=Streptomyces sp. NA02950 TaxID=2742137 RepID=UPI00158FC330|nr:hypothetical protein [Streptomyces sp. NA02950]QKV92016.1 hypothetical protein HUT19_09890 [Streptomyces sp. NA02950]